MDKMGLIWVKGFFLVLSHKLVSQQIKVKLVLFYVKILTKFLKI